VGVGESEDVQAFYYFVESENNPKEDPLMLWLTGGPGCSALSGLFIEIGNSTIIVSQFLLYFFAILMYVIGNYMIIAFECCRPTWFEA